MSASKNPKVWIVAADVAHAIVLQPETAVGRFVTVSETDAPGYTHAHGKHDASHHLAVADKVEFAKDLASTLDAAAARGAYDQLVLVAPAQTLHSLREALGTQAAKRVVGSESKDIVKLPLIERDAHLKRWWLAPA